MVAGLHPIRTLTQRDARSKLGQQVLNTKLEECHAILVVKLQQ